MKIKLITGNKNKAREIEEILKEYGIKIEIKKIKIEEIQSENLEEIILNSIRKSFEIEKERMISEDSGLFIKALKGFPGPYSSYVYKTIGNKGILKLMEKIKEREAKFLCFLAYKDKKIEKIFIGEAKGKISYEIKGKGWGFDPIFIPENYNKTFGEMELKEKNKCSHRGIAVRKFAEWFIKEFSKS